MADINHPQPRGAPVRILQRILVALALAASATLVAPTGPAQAQVGHDVEICFPADSENGNQVIWNCHLITVPKVALKPGPWPDECLSCPTYVDFLDQVKPWEQWEYLDRLGQGLFLLSRAKLTKDPKLHTRLRQRATEQFLLSAETLHGTGILLGDTGWVDLQNDKVYGDNTLIPLGTHLVEGLMLMQPPVPGDPTPQPNIDKAMHHFNLALKELEILYAG